jgi:hypothetical protein
MHLPILAVAFAIYIFGIAAVLVLRPTLMFRPGGTWKEFGIGRGENHSIFPFWLFAIFWAFISYGLGLVIMSQFAILAMSPEPGMPSMQQMASPMQQMASPMQQMASQQMPMQSQQAAPSFMKPVSSMMGLPSNSVPGFYVLQNVSGQQPQYVYYGTEPPPVK